MNCTASCNCHRESFEHMSIHIILPFPLLFSHGNQKSVSYTPMSSSSLNVAKSLNYPLNKGFQAPTPAPVTAPGRAREALPRTGSRSPFPAPGTRSLIKWNPCSWCWWAQLRELPVPGSWRAGSRLPKTRSRQKGQWWFFWEGVRAEMTAEECDFKGPRAVWYCNVLKRVLKGKRLILAR